MSSLSVCAPTSRQLPDEILLHALLMLPEEERTPVKLDAWRQVNGQFNAVLQEDVFWRLFTPQQQQGERPSRCAAFHQELERLPRRWGTRLASIYRGVGDARLGAADYLAQSALIAAAYVFVHPAELRLLPLVFADHEYIAPRAVRLAPTQAFASASRRLQRREEILQSALTSDGNLLAACSLGVRRNSDWVRKSVRSAPSSFRFARGSLRTDARFVATLFADLAASGSSEAEKFYAELPRALRVNPAFFQAAIKNQSGYIRDVMLWQKVGEYLLDCKNVAGAATINRRETPSVYTLLEALLRDGAPLCLLYQGEVKATCLGDEILFRALLQAANRQAHAEPSAQELHDAADPDLRARFDVFGEPVGERQQEAAPSKSWLSWPRRNNT